MCNYNLCQIESNLRNKKKFCQEHELVIEKLGFLIFFKEVRVYISRDAFVHTYKNNDIKAALAVNYRIFLLHSKTYVHKKINNKNVFSGVFFI